MITGSLNGKSLYAKGTMYVKHFDPATNDLLYFSDKVATNQLQSTVNLGAINAGIGNPVVIQIPDTPSLTLNMTAADFSLEARALATGSQVTYNGVVPVDEAIEAAGTSLSVSQPPCAPLGSCDVVCYINSDGTAYPINPDSMQIEGFQAQTGETYCVHYYTRSAAAKQFSIDTLMNPAVVRTLIAIPIYATEGGQGASHTGSRVGTLYITIPRLQFNGDATTEGSQTTAATTNLTGNALSYNAACESGVQCGASASPKLAYMVLALDGDPDQYVRELAIVGGTNLEAVHGTPLPLPVKYIMEDGSLATPLMSNLEFTVPDESASILSVSPLGVVSGLKNGSGTVEITSRFNRTLTISATVSVSGAPADVPTANVSFTLTTPSPDAANKLSGGGAAKAVSVNVANATASVVLTAAKTAAQNITVGGADAASVKAGGSATAPTYTVDTASIKTAGGKKTFTLTVAEDGKTSLTYTVTVTVAAAGG